jgi:hypothetical protein
MIQIVHRARVRGTARHERENVIKSAFSDTGTWIGTVSDIGAVFDADGVQMGLYAANLGARVLIRVGE